MRKLNFQIFCFAVALAAVAGLLLAPSLNNVHSASAAVVEPIVVPFGKVILNSINGNLYAAEGQLGAITVIDPATNIMVGPPITVSSDGSGNPNGIAFDPATGNVYVTSGNEVTSFINATTNKVDALIDTGFGSTQGPLAFNSVNGKLYFASTYDNFLHIIDSATNKAIGSPIQLDGVPAKIAFSSVSGNVYVTVSSDINCGVSCTSIDSRRVVVINGTSDTIEGGPILVGTSPTGIVSNPTNDNLYVLNSGNNTVSVINGTTNTVIGEPIPVGFNATTNTFNPYNVGSSPSPITFNPINGKVYVISNDNTLTVIDSATNKAVGDPISLPGSTVPALGTPLAIGINPVDGDVYVISSHAFFTDIGAPGPGLTNDSTLTVIDGATNKIVGPVLGLGSNFPLAIGVHPDSGMLYSLNIVNGTLSVTDPLQPPLSISFVSFISHFHEGGPFPGFGAPVTDDVISGCSYGLYGQATKQGDSIVGFWSNLNHRGFQTGDFGTFNQLTTDGKTFESEGMRMGAGDGTMQVICAGEPVSNSGSPVIVTGDCGPNSQMTFTVGDNIEEVFIGDSTCAIPITLPQQHSNLTVKAVDIGGMPLRGDMWTVVRSVNGTVLKSGFTPLTFEGMSGSIYKVSVSNYDGKIFSKWQDDGSISRTRIINLSANTTLTALYDTGDALRGFTSLTYTGTAEQPDLTVNAKSLDGSTTLHMWTIIDPQSTDASGTMYKVYIHDYKDKVFDRWEDGSTERVRTLTIRETTNITAYYKTG